MEGILMAPSPSRWRALWADLSPLERGAYLGLFAAAIFTRLWRLGDRVMSHDESLHVYYAWQLFRGNGFQHTPLMHGPLKFHLDALAYLLFGADDFSGRLPVALAGIALVMFPLFMRRWLGRWGSLLASLFFLISPMILYHSRYIRDEGLMALWAVLTVWMIFAYLETREARWLYGLAAVMALFYTTMEAAFIYLAIYGLLLFLAWSVTVLRDPRCSREDRQWLGVGAASLLAGGAAMLFGLESGREPIPGAFVCRPENIPEHGRWITLVGGLIALAGIGVLAWVLAGRWGRNTRNVMGQAARAIRASRSHQRIAGPMKAHPNLEEITDLKLKRTGSVRCRFGGHIFRICVDLHTHPLGQVLSAGIHHRRDEDPTRHRDTRMAGVKLDLTLEDRHISPAH